MVGCVIFESFFIFRTLGDDLTVGSDADRNSVSILILRLFCNKNGCEETSSNNIPGEGK